MKTSKRIIAVTFAALLIIAGVASPGHAATGTGHGIGAGDTHCTDYDQTDNGTVVVAQLFNGTGEVTVRRAETVGGPETVVFQSPIGALTGWPGVVQETISPTEPGMLLYRVCIEVDEVTGSLAQYGLSLLPTSGFTVVDLGPETAAISQDAKVCGDNAEVIDNRVRLVGSASGEVRWTIFAHAVEPWFEGDQNIVVADAATIDETVILDPFIVAVHVCAINLTNPQRVSISFELSS